MTTPPANNQANAAVYIGAASPLFQYSPTRNGPLGSSWLQGSEGTSCAGPSTFAVQLDALYFSQVIFQWSSSNGFAVQVGIDGTLQGGTSKNGVTLTAPLGQHDVRLETVCEGCGNGQTFTLEGITLDTFMDGNNATLDDASSSMVTYSGFTSTTPSTSSIPGISSGKFYQNTVSYSASPGSSATFQYTGNALYIFGPTGPDFGVFSITVDGQKQGVFNASTTLDTYDTLLWWIAGLSEGAHELVMGNEGGGVVAIDYVVAVSPSNPDAGGAKEPTGGGGAGVTTTVVGGVTTTLVGQTPTAVFPGQGGQQGSVGNGKNGAAELAIGLTLGILAAIILLWFGWRYYRWRKAGGSGNFWVALCGARERKKTAAPKEDKFKLWPMLSYKPKYAT